MSVVSQPGTDIPSVTVNTTGVQPTNSMTVLVKDIFGVPIDGAKMTSNLSNSAPAEYTIYPSGANYSPVFFGGRYTTISGNSVSGAQLTLVFIYLMQ
jgi:hypothetical protein